MIGTMMTDITGHIVHISWEPLVPVIWLAICTGLITIMTGYGIWHRVRGSTGRMLAGLLFLAMLANPSLRTEDRRSQPDIGVITVDESPSMQIGDRQAQARKAVASLTQGGAASDGIEWRIVHFGASTKDHISDDTRLGDALDQALQDVPRNRLAATIVISDGQIHDLPTTWPRDHGPFHLLVTGQRNEQDRRLRLVEAPAYGMSGQEVAITLRVEDLSPGKSPDAVTVHVRKDQEDAISFNLETGIDQTINIPVTHPGQNVIDLSVDALPGEISTLNNHTQMVVNGVRDRLKVLLVSGAPHAGERTWRNLLKSDPAVDLVHFTILRTPEKQDATPIRELSLIAFPVRELFEIKLHDFDLVIFDNYDQHGILPPNYYDNIAEYVRSGGALLVANGAGYGGNDSLYYSGLADILPVEPAGPALNRAFRPQLTPAGRRHIVTTTLAPPKGETEKWGEWFRTLPGHVKSGDVLMTGADNQPLLILDHVEKGRIAQFNSDHIWLWDRGYKGGGPYAELMRRLAHWLMKEPSLAENSLTASIDQGTLTLTRRDVQAQESQITLTAPDGQTRNITIPINENGIGTWQSPVSNPGVWRAEDGALLAVAMAGRPNPPEMNDLRASDQPARADVTSSGGGVFWLGDPDQPELRRTDLRDRQYGRTWLGLARRNQSDIIGSHQYPLLSPIITMFFGALILFLAWRRESR